LATKLVPRTRRSALSALTRVFDALRRCDAEPGPISAQIDVGPGSCGASLRAAPCPGHGRRCGRPLSPLLAQLRPV